MEIKIECGCGTRYKFEIEPVGGRMPSGVNCPACGVDGTNQANEVMRRVIEQAASPQVEPSPSEIPPSVSRIRLALPATPSATSGQPSHEFTPPPIAPIVPVGGRAKIREPRASNKLMRSLSTAFALVIIAFAVWRFGAKWYRRVDTVARVAQIFGAAGVDSPQASEDKNLWYEDCSILFIKQTNQIGRAHV